MWDWEKREEAVEDTWRTQPQLGGIDFVYDVGTEVDAIRVHTQRIERVEGRAF